MLTMRNRKITFLDLPGEILNLIYGFALTGDDPLHHRVVHSREGFYDSECNSKAKEFNQLQHVCVQLREETAGLELRHNDLVFYGEDGARRFQDFAQYLPVSWRARLRNIFITEPQETVMLHGISLRRLHKEAISPLLALCKSLPFMVIYIELSDTEAIKLGMRGILEKAMEAIVVRNGSMPEELNSYEKRYGFLPSWQAKDSDLYIKDCPHNFRFKPVGKFDEQALRQFIVEDDHDLVGLDTDMCVCLAKRWYLEGFLSEDERALLARCYC
jgi:hypothetical protein